MVTSLYIGVSNSLPTTPPVPENVAETEVDVVSTATAVATVTAAELAGMDLEMAMMLVQLDRSNNLETSLKDQLRGVAKRNEGICALNTLISDIRNVRSSNGTGGPDSYASLGKDPASGKELYGRLFSAGVKMPGAPGVLVEGESHQYVATQKTLDVWLEDLKGKIDALSNSQQTDMLRLQSLNNKHNESFDILTNFIKKMSDSRASIVGNMR